MKRLLIYFFLILFPMMGHAQTWKWERKLALHHVGSYGYLIGSTIVVDNAGNSYAIIQDSSIFYDGKTHVNINDPSLIKISPAGNVIWKAPIHLTQEIDSLLFTNQLERNWSKIKIEANGNIIVCGNLPGTINLGSITLPASAAHPDPTLGLPYGSIWTQLFIAECDTSGTWENASVLGATTNLTVLAGIEADKNSNIFVCGTNSYYVNIGSVTTPFHGTFLLSAKMNGSVNWLDTFSYIFTNDNTPIWNLNGLKADINGNLYMSLAASFIATNKVDTSYIYKISSNGTILFVKKLPLVSYRDLQLNNISVDRLGNIYAVGYQYGSYDFGNGVVINAVNSNFTGFLVKYDSNFKAQWVQSLKPATLQNVCLDDSGDVFVTGSFAGQLILGDSVYKSGNPGSEQFIVEYAPDQVIKMSVFLTGYNLNSLAIDPSGNLIIDGYFSDSIRFGCDTLNGNTNGYIAKLDPRPLTIKKTPFCTGDSLICTDTNLYSNLVWKFRDGTTQTGNKIAYFGNAGKYNHFTLYATNAVGCQVSVSDSFKIPAPPVVAFSFKDSIACEYTKVILSDISKSDTLAAGNWPQDTWNFGDGTTSNSNKTAIKIFKDTGSFAIKLSYNNGFCAKDTSMNIRVIPAPKPGFSVSDSNGCQPLTVKITSQTTGAITHTFFDFGNGTNDTIPSPTVVYPKSGNYKILQKLTGPSGCVTEDSVNIRVRPVFTLNDSADIAYVSVANSQTLIFGALEWPLLQGASVYHLYRYVDHDSTNAILLPQAYSRLFSDSDHIDPAAHTYTYYLNVQDSCGNISSHGRVGRTIRLTGKLDENLNPKLSWNPYIDWKGGVGSYFIVRQKLDKSIKIIGQTHDTTFTDSAFLDSAYYDVCYFVFAYSDNSSTSNIFCFGNSPQIFIPDVFTPDGDTLNDIFVPVSSGIRSWSMDIYNRWGEKVASPQNSKNPLGFSPEGEGVGWDGNFKGQPAPQGVYVYDIKATDYYGNIITRKGTVILMR